ncbi:FHA domain-containing protein [Pseudoduganella umbonata]|uniref:FHA domain-containing protein n=1 Tax=Pseudoduganella umbonata TaxID=864828 RepID=A0A4P8HS48_9BURK|nr:FHA domain-containing protein [Pseudoduganella umbonata]MBB3220459.1 pSer/pThr/pTyr-binding forkhead associated (FHA) protein [Pseudoduganella umbonata]QCP12016.1 FHA domain-containing protein [Pseudoduganella umbonata]
MAKILISRDGVLEKTVQLTKERMTVGRHGHNDIVLEHQTVSGEHAAITTILDDSFLEDLQSTNGTFVNGHRVGKHFLQHGDTIKLAKYRIEFVADGIRPISGVPALPLPLAPARIEVLNGSNAGRLLELNKPQTSLGRAGVQVVTVNRTEAGYAAVHADGDRVPLLNGAPLGKLPQALADGDVLDLSGTRMTFRLG